MVKSSPLLVAAACAVSMFALTIRAADDKPDMSKVPPPAEKKGLVYEKDIKPLLEKSCFKCHTGDKPKGKYHMDTLPGLIKGGDSGDPAVKPGHSDQSPFVLYASGAVQDMEMPPLDKRDKYPALTKEQIGLVRAWIDQGAK